MFLQFHIVEIISINFISSEGRVEKYKPTPHVVCKAFPRLPQTCLADLTERPCRSLLLTSMLRRSDLYNVSQSDQDLNVCRSACQFVSVIIAVSIR